MKSVQNLNSSSHLLSQSQSNWHKLEHPLCSIPTASNGKFLTSSNHKDLGHKLTSIFKCNHFFLTLPLGCSVK